MVDISKENVTIAINVKSHLFLNSLAYDYEIYQ